MIKYAIFSLKKDFKQAIFYWLTFVLTTAFTFSIFNLSFGENQLLSISGGDYQQGSSLISIMLCLVIVIAMFASFYANDYYITTKAKELAVNLISGASYAQLTVFLMFQNTIIMLSSIPLGVIVGYISLPLQAFLLNDLLNTPIEIVHSSMAIYGTTIIVAFEVIWCVILNLGYAYRSSILDLLQQGKTKFGTPKHLLPNFIFILLYLVGIYLIIQNGQDVTAYFGYAIIGAFALYGIDRYVVPKYLKKYISAKTSNKPEALVYLNYIKTNLQKMNLPILVLVISSSLLIALMAFYYPSLETMIALLCYGMVILLMGLSINIKYMGIIEGRVLEFYHLYHFGYTRNQLKSLMFKEVVCFYLLLLVLSSTYGFLILIKLYLTEMMGITIILSIIGITIGVFALMAGASYTYYLYRINRVIKQEK